MTQDEPAQDGTYTLAELVATLQDDNPVVVQQIMGNGRTADVDSALTELAAEVDYPVFVALVNRPPGLREDRPAEELASLLHARIGQDGLYVVAVDAQIGSIEWETYGAAVPDRYDVYPSRSGGYDPDGPAQSAAGQTAELLSAAAHDGRPPGDDVEEFRTDPLWIESASRAGDVDPPTDGTYAVVSTTLAISLAAVALVVVRTLARWRELAPDASAVAGRTRLPASRAVRAPRAARAPRGPAGAPAPDAATVRDRAERELDALAAAVDRAHRGEAAPSAEAMRVVDGSRIAAEGLLAEPDLPLLDALGALVLVRGAQQALDRPSGPTYRPCFLNPWHGAGRETVSLDSGGEQVEVPVCAPCRRAVTRQEPPEALEVPRRWGGPRRYYEADTVWARTGFGAISDDLWRLVLDDRDGRS